MKNPNTPVDFLGSRIGDFWDPVRDYSLMVFFANEASSLIRDRLPGTFIRNEPPNGLVIGFGNMVYIYYGLWYCLFVYSVDKCLISVLRMHER